MESEPMVDLRRPAAFFAAALVSSAAYASPELARAKNCVACHHVERKMNGPAYKTVAEKYANDEAAAIKTLSEKIRKGGSGVWGPAPMPPQPAVSEEEAEALAKWILSNK
jgi:cytochrome c